jgi:hypothetical protein
MLSFLFEMVGITLFWNRVGRHLERRQERKGPYGAPVVTVVAAVIGATAAVGLLLVERRMNPGVRVPIWPLAVASVRLVLIVLIADCLRLSAIARRGGGVYFGIMLAEVVNLGSLIVDGIAAISAALGHSFNLIISVGGGSSADLVSRRYLWALTAVAAVGFLADVIIGLALLIRRHLLD